MTELPLVIHVLPYDLPRGAQRYAKAMRLALDAHGASHRTLTIFESVSNELDADIKLNLPMNRLARLGLDPRAVLSLRQRLQALRPHVVVAHGGQPLKYLAAVTPVGAKLVYYKIGIAHAGAHRPLRRLFHSALLKRAQVVAGVSQECLDEAASVFGVPSSRLVLIPNGRDPSLFFPAVELHSGPPLVTFVGHLSSTKRPERFIELIRRLRAEGLELRAQLVGDGPLRSSLSELARLAGVELLGRRSDIPELLRESDIFVFTSVPDGEGMPGVFIEAGLSALPVVTTDVPGASVVANEASGFVVGVDDFEQQLASLRRVVVDAELRRRLGAAARERCVEHFSLRSSIGLWQSLIEAL